MITHKTKPSECNTKLDLSDLEASRQHLDEFLKYSLNPKLSSFSTQDKLVILKLCEQMGDLVVQLRITRAYFQNNAVKKSGVISKGKASEANLKSNGQN